MMKKSPLANKQSQLFYTCGVEKSYVVLPKDRLDYERATKKPLDFIRKFEEREILTKKVKQGGKVGSYIYSEKTVSKSKAGQKSD